MTPTGAGTMSLEIAPFVLWLITCGVIGIVLLVYGFIARKDLR